ncbi:triosephosphate isomerase [Nitritalea halalkaliphila LW7]|uniref:Triosephosphate isomerase n=1 Tax=Nitritalea halalkaliphila LW7 TaxID=1189621 RepID=I5C5T6_9BACT|nr:triose-phosphate isomerase [Nitritalea halalkaliphila]EIM77188.1 triosephosphate isomerase [Nitritalea halalkaliphila LW7]
MREKIVAGNWKMNLTFEEGQKLTSEIVQMFRDENPAGVKLVLNPPFPHLYPVKKLIGDTANVFLGAQNCYDKASGAYTGEVPAAMLRSFGASFVILGHSERRAYFGEDSAFLLAKTKQALAAGLRPIFCCGEPLEIREADTHVAFVVKQLEETVFQLSAEEFAQVVIAYEPIWAIGTGKTASAEQAQEMHAALRAEIAKAQGQAAADACPILYGGSCNAENASSIFAKADVDGGLIGGASLKSRDFIAIAKSF